MRFFLFCATLSIFTYQCFKANAQVIRFEHKANRLEGFTDISLKEGILSFESGSRKEGFIVIESDAPLVLKSTNNVVAALFPGWDGTLGYKLYGIRFKVEQAGASEIRLQIIEPPNQAIATSREEIERYKDQLDSRPSKFPGEASDFLSWQRRYRDSLAGTLMGGGLPDMVPG
ncbi:MAG: hypothetical protein KAI95_10980, partial [Bacteroidales bacterium]|nr:hypothetical protein [Bacteroidales bacterium]